MTKFQPQNSPETVSFNHLSNKLILNVFILCGKTFSSANYQYISAVIEDKEKEMSDKEKFEIEFEVKSSTSVLFNMISTASGLSEWFADNVNLKDDTFIFIWDGSEEQAKLIGKKKGESIKFQWIDDYEEGLKTYFELAIKVDDLTNDVALIITDFAEEDELEEAKLLWTNQISELKMTIGSQ